MIFLYIKGNLFSFIKIEANSSGLFLIKINKKILKLKKFYVKFLSRISHIISSLKLKFSFKIFNFIFIKNSFDIPNPFPNIPDSINLYGLNFS